MTGSDKIVQRIIRETGIPDLLRVLTDRLPASDLQSLLLDVYRRRSANLKPGQLLSRFREDRFVRPVVADARQLLEFDQCAIDILPDDFEFLELSPLTPLGTSSVLAPVNQNNLVSTIRNTEVAADPTGILALEAAVRRKKNKQKMVKLAASQRIVRAQTFDEAASFAHFKLFCMCVAGRSAKRYEFELNSLSELLRCYLQLFEQQKTRGATITGTRCSIKTPDENLAGELGSLKKELSQDYGDMAFEVEVTADGVRNYYNLLRFQIYLTDARDQEFLIGDGGDTDWICQLLNDQKEKLMTSGIGSERFVYCFYGEGN